GGERHQRQDASHRGSAPNREQDRWGAAVRGRVDKDGTGIWVTAREARPLRARRPSASTGDSRHAAGLTDGAARSVGNGEGGRATGSNVGAGVYLRADPRGFPARRADVGEGASAVGRRGARLPAWRGTGGTLRFQACPDSRRCLSVTA